MIELLGKAPRSVTLSGKYSKKIFNHKGELRRIKGLNYWSLDRVLIEKYKFKPSEATALCEFLLPMLEWDPEERSTA